MSLKTSYIILVILFVCCSIGYWFFMERILFFLYGYKQSLIRSDTVESFAAYKKIALGKKVFLIINILLSFGCAVASYYVRKSQIGITYHVVSVVFYVSVILSVLSLIVFILSFFIPTRIV